MFRFITYFKRNRKENEQILEYFHTCMDEINERNLYMLRKICMYISFVYIFVLIATRILVPYFEFSKAHFLMFPLLTGFYFFNRYSRNNSHKLSTNIVGVLCITFYFILAIILIMLDTSTTLMTSIFWLPMLLMIFPIFYIDRMYKYGSFELIVIILYILQAKYTKPDAVVLRDVYLINVAYVLSMLEAHMVLEMRSRECLSAKELKRISSLDKLTHVLNKGALVAQIEDHLTMAPEEESVALCIIDLDNFKYVNDNLGHTTGDILLERVGQLLIENFRACDIIGRYGGDEFVVMMPIMNDLTILQMRCRAVQMFLTDFSLTAGQSFSVSIGAVISGNIRNYETLLKMADNALYRSKLNGKNCSTAWILEEREYEKPMILSVRSRMDEGVAKLYAAKGAQYDIVSSDNDNDALCKISQFQSQLKMVLLELDVERELGETVLKYVKTREAFATIPIVVVAKEQQAKELATELDADEVVLKNSPDEMFIEAIDRCLQRE